MRSAGPRASAAPEHSTAHTRAPAGVDLDRIVTAPNQEVCDELQEVLLGSDLTAASKADSAEAMGNRESKEAAARAAAQREREAALEAKSDAQGGRWLDATSVAAEPRQGYGLRHHHESQAAQPAVRAALARGQNPQAQERAEKVKAARAAEQGGRWLGGGEVARGAAVQGAQPEVRAAAAAARAPEFQVRGDRASGF